MHTFPHLPAEMKCEFPSSKSYFSTATELSKSVDQLTSHQHPYNNGGSLSNSAGLMLNTWNTRRTIKLSECPPPMLTVNGKRRGRKPGVNSTLAQRSAANARERSRMRVLSSAFVDLKGALPWVPKDTKLSKLDTLKLAAGYIAYLKNVLNEDSESCSSLFSPDSQLPYSSEYSSVFKHPLTYTWPYNVSKMSSDNCLHKTNLSATNLHHSERSQFSDSVHLLPISGSEQYYDSQLINS